MEGCMEGAAVIATSATFDDLVAIHRPRIFRFAFASLRDRDTAESVTQDCFLRAYQAWPQFRGDSTVQTWLTRIAINLIRDAARSRRFQFWKQQADVIDSFIPDTATSPEQRLAAKQQVAAVWK